LPRFLADEHQNRGSFTLAFPVSARTVSRRHIYLTASPSIGRFSRPTALARLDRPPQSHSKNRSATLARECQQSRGGLVTAGGLLEIFPVLLEK